MSDAAPVVWLAPDGGPGAPSADAARLLADWAHARGLRLTEPDAPSSGLPIDPSTVDRVEAELESARSAVAAADADAAERALARAEALLRGHPELPEAAWLRAEVDRGWAVRWLRLEPRDEARARAAWEHAAALDGARVPGIGETSSPPPATVPVTLVVHGPNEALVVRVDGRAVGADAAGARRVDLAPGEHQLVATVAGRVAFASWVTLVGSSPAPVHVEIGGGSPCAGDRLAAVRATTGGVDARGVSCPSWIVAAPAPRAGGVVVARCERDTCAPLLEWRSEVARAEPPAPVAKDTRAGWPRWATWTLAGVGAATAVSLGVLAAGALADRPVEQRFVSGGARQE